MRLVACPHLLAISLCFSACAPAIGAGPAAPSAPTEQQDATELFARGRAAAEQGDSVRAEQYLSLAMENGYDRRAVLPLLLRVCLSSSRLRAALNHAEPYLREHPEDDALRYLVATIHVGLGQTRAARLLLEQLLRHEPAYAEAHYLLGVLDSTTDPDAARNRLRNYLELAPRGEHAAEVRDRLAELAVRDEAARRLAYELRPGVPGSHVQPSPEVPAENRRDETIAEPTP